LSILVAEDNEINALLARALLTRLGHRPTIAVNGEAAVESWLAARASGCRYDLVLMDLQMPGIDGLEAHVNRAAEACRATSTRMIARLPTPKQRIANQFSMRASTGCCSSRSTVSGCAKSSIPLADPVPARLRRDAAFPTVS
jgi:DNA-binding NarL/FixJ family response regulator